MHFLACNYLCSETADQAYMYMAHAWPYIIWPHYILCNCQFVCNHKRIVLVCILRSCGHCKYNASARFTL